jgi:hypothetical protein
MLFSFASVAISLWLGLVAVGCLRRLWGASANDGSGYSGRDYARAANSENHHRHRDLGSEGFDFDDFSIIDSCLACSDQCHPSSIESN